ncbi:unnamed protein product [Cylicocyclus nassatus]|uniref:Metalloendopeptidase n=1 Tax=Cylicocyclus nassatus TaxID=53992 RepID=A0AA36GYV1_CYLNA|nr:unnamed protein product [Cylicocyclus nassatus]
MYLLELLFFSGLAAGAVCHAYIYFNFLSFVFKLPVSGRVHELNAKGTVFQAFEMYRLKSCIDFKPYEGEKSFIKFEKQGGCFSSVGKQPSGQVLSLGTRCDHKAIVEHELLHALGFYHMQSRQDRDDYVKIWLDQVTDGHSLSTKTPDIPTITTNIPEFYNIIGQYLDFSEQDVVRLNKMYNCSSTLTLLDQCTFEYINICGMIQSPTDDEDWVHTKSTPGSEDHTLIGQCRGDDDKGWKIAHVPMDVGVKFRYAFQGVKGDPSNSNGGMFIDDISLVETRCPSAVWRIQNFSQIMAEADHNTFLDSPPFYSPEGYAYGIRVYPLANYTDYTGNYTGLYFHLASGENDMVMQWPAVDRQATLVVMDQDPDIKLRMSSARSLTTDLSTTPEDKLYWDNPARLEPTTLPASATEVNQWDGEISSNTLIYADVIT